MNESVFTNKENEIKVQALIDNTAQGIFNYLKEIENKREVYEKRWIWELLQNALDATRAGQKMEVQLVKDNNKLTFVHNGRPFKSEEVAHLIYHGSTKREQDIGKFGTGFLVTHLLSKKVKVRGVREDGKKIEFELDRNGASADDIKNLMEKTWVEYQKALDTMIETEYTAQFEYRLSDISLNTVETGISALIRIAPYVLAFNDKLGVIKISNKPNELKFELIRETNESERIIKKEVKEEKVGNLPIFHELWIAKDNDVDIAIKVRRGEDNSYQIEKLENIPKIFIAFPLFGTQDLPFPAVINSRKFEPTEKRDGIYLGKENTDDVNRNKRLLEKASELFINLVSNSDSNRWENIHTILKLGYPPEKDWLDKEWYIGLLRVCIGKILKSNILKTENGSFIAPDNCLVPIFDGSDDGKVKRLWDLCYRFLDYRDRIPAKELAFEWAQIINEWISIGLDLGKIKITIEKLVEEIERRGNLQGFKSKLSEDRDEFETLNDSYRLLLDSAKSGLLDSRSIIPDQNGNFRKKPALLKDEGIDEILKDISKKLGVDVRSQLLHSSIFEEVQKLVSVKKEDDVLNNVINKIKQPYPKDEQYLQANIGLFNWLLERDKFEYFEGYPVLSSKEETFTTLSRQSKEKLLAPKDVWNATARVYADLFPQDLIISSVYFEEISQEDEWNKLKDSGFVIINPLYKEADKINRDDLDSLLVSEELAEDKEHEITTDVELSKIPFFETKDKGVINTVRKSRDKARKLLDFLFDYVIENDNQWNNPVEVSCKCGSKHKIYPALWFGTLKDRAWVPVRKDKSEKPNAQFLASIIGTAEKLVEKCKQDKPSILLRRLNINLSELMMHVAAKDDTTRIELDRAMGSLFSTFMENPNQLSKIAKLAEVEPELFIKAMNEHIQNAEEVRRNQHVGALVEKVVKTVLEKEKEVFEVERTGTGSDFVIKIKKGTKECFLEIKSTSQDFVRMTLTQAKEARDKSDKYALCVVRVNDSEINEETIKSGAKFVVDIGQKLRDKVNDAENLKGEEEKIAVAGDIEIEISEGPIHFKINKRIWEGGKTLDQFFTFLRGL